MYYKSLHGKKGLFVKVMSSWSVNLHTLFLGRLRSPKPLTSTTYIILSLITDNCPSCISRRGRMAVEIIWPGHAKMCLSYANNKGADQLAHPHSLISTFVVRCLDSMVCILAISKVSRF